MIQERIDELKDILATYEETMKVVDKLRDELTQLEEQQNKERFDALPFEEKFGEWFGKGEILDDSCILEDLAPKFYKRYVDGGEFYRHKTYNVSEQFGEEFHAIFDTETRNELRKRFKTQEKFDKEYAKIVECAKELMENDIAGWVYDW